MREQRLNVESSSPEVGKLELPSSSDGSPPPNPVRVRIPDEGIGPEIIKVTSVIRGTAVLRDTVGHELGRVTLDRGENHIRVSRRT